MKTFFCNRTVDKGEMKRLIKWVLLNYGTEKTTRLIDQLKTMGFHYATHAGLSLGIDDLRIPPIKSTFLKNANQDIYENDLRLQRGQITSVQRLEKALDIWNTTNDTLKTEVIKYFRATDIFNPVYMMAFSGATWKYFSGSSISGNAWFNGGPTRSSIRLSDSSQFPRRLNRY